MNYQVKVHKVYDTDKPVKALVSVKWYYQIQGGFL